MGTVTPSWTDNVTILAAQVLARGNTLRGTIDLRTKHGAKLFIRVGRGGTTALTAGVAIFVRALLNNGAAGGAHPGSVVPRQTSYTAAVRTTVDDDSNSAQNNLNVADITGFTVRDIICIQDADAGVTRLEFHRIAKTAAGVLTMDRPLDYTHLGTDADTVTNKADVYAPMWIPGGSLYEVVFDYASHVAGESITLQVMAQTYDQDTIT